MRSDLYLDLFLKEDTHWWHVGKRILMEQLIRKYMPHLQENAKLLDVGCGTGRMLDMLAGFGTPWGIDMSEEALDFCRQRGFYNLLRHDLNQPFDFDFNFDVISALDVIEHLEDDLQGLRNLRKALKPNGILIISVPSYQFMFSYWDVALGHKKRYTLKSLTKVVESAGYTIVKKSYTNTSILIPAAVIRFLKGLAGRINRKIYARLLSEDTDFTALPKPLNDFLISLYNIENRLVLTKGLPVGLSALVVCKPDLSN
ncbi:class I SAM-dependent methyltransferase [Candidatus Chlorohelix sp.]|uniref:class I SAM-dependent methyltransferase n=1 Tax=Candidatus Chlorohelix sp. TaxID=3139201 RepID=UPI0030487B81